MLREKFNFKIGMIGVGFLGQCLAEGLIKLGTDVILSPRNLKRTASLKQQPKCMVAANNSDVVARASVVLLATLPNDIASTAKDLPWRENQSAVSVAAGIQLSEIAAAVRPAKAFRAMPISAARLLESPTAFYPHNDRIFQLFSSLGSAHPVKDYREFEIASIFGAFYGHIYALVDEASHWAETNGLEAKYARVLAACMMRSVATNVIENNDQRPREILKDLLTPGGITETGLEILDTSGALQKWQEALDSSLQRSRQINSS